VVVAQFGPGGVELLDEVAPGPVTTITFEGVDGGGQPGRGCRGELLPTVTARRSSSAIRASASARRSWPASLARTTEAMNACVLANGSSTAGPISPRSVAAMRSSTSGGIITLTRLF